MIVIAHRGDSGRYPENTLAAFHAAVELDVDEIELDVCMTADGELVVMHDETVDRTTNGEGEINELTLREIKRLDAGAWFHERFRGEPVPTLDEALAAVPPSVVLNVHMKRPDPPRAELAIRTVKTLRRFNRIETSYVAASKEDIETVATVCPQIRLCNLSCQDSPEVAQMAAALGCQMNQFNSAYVTREMIGQAHQLGLRANVFYADEPEEMQKFIEWGADAILTNYPDRLLQLLGRLEHRENQL